MKRTLVAETARPVTFIWTNPKTKRVENTKRREAGTRVYVERETMWGYEVRICGTLWKQTIPASAFVVVDVREG